MKTNVSFPLFYIHTFVVHSFLHFLIRCTNVRFPACFLILIFIANGAILNLTESKLIFGNIPDLLRIHEALLNELQIVIDELTIGKNRSLGKCFLNHTQREQFGKTYRNGQKAIIHYNICCTFVFTFVRPLYIRCTFVYTFVHSFYIRTSVVHSLYVRCTFGFTRTMAKNHTVDTHY